MTTGRINQVTTFQKAWERAVSERIHGVPQTTTSTTTYTNPCNKHSTRQIIDQKPTSSSTGSSRHKALKARAVLTTYIHRHQYHSPQPYQFASSTSVPVLPPFCQDTRIWQRREHPFATFIRPLQGYRIRIQHTANQYTHDHQASQSVLTAQTNCSFSMATPKCIHSQWVFSTLRPCRY